MEEPIISIENVSKKYRLGEAQPYVTLRDTLVSVFKKTLRKEREEFWSLKDISLKVFPGEIVGIIGRNGAGKSTLLKILSKITPPTKGEIRLRGKVASLLEVGTGFSPELTGRENIYLNAAILGMTRREINSLFQEIVDFAEVEKFIDTPVKHYSSGMYMRLAFAVAAHLSSDILFVDEVLAVGDAAFQAKCLEKMGEISKQGRTILFVSHSMQAVAKLCSRTILLDSGKIKLQGDTSKVIAEYLQIGKSRKNIKIDPTVRFPKDTETKMQIRKITILDKNNKPNGLLGVGEPFSVEFEYEVYKPVLDVYTTAILSSQDYTRFLDSQESDSNPSSLGKKAPGKYSSRIHFPNWLNEGTYSLMIVFESGQQTFDKQVSAQFRISDTKIRTYGIQGRAPLMDPLHWETVKL